MIKYLVSTNNYVDYIFFYRDKNHQCMKLNSSLLL